MTRVSIDLDLSVEDTWAAASDLKRFDDWLLLHDGWRSPLPAPDELAEGVGIVSVVKVKGTRVRFDWTIEKYRRLEQVQLTGNGKGGVKAKLDLAVTPPDSGSTITVTVDLGGLPLMGPAGKAAAIAVSGDLHTSLERFRQVFG